MDVLSDIFDVVRLRGSLYFRSEFSPPWAIRVPSFSNVARFHLVIRGSCWAEVDDAATPVRLETGDLLVIPHGRGHVLMDAPGRRPVALDTVVEEAGFRGEGALVYGGDGGTLPTRLVCGHFAFSEHGGRLLLDSLPAHIHVRRSEGVSYDWLDEGMRFITHETIGGSIGATAVVNRLAEILFIQTIRHFAATAPVGVLAGLRDSRVGKALAAIHASPAADWTVDSLARLAGLSRTIFTERMRGLVGMPPMQYLTVWRMENAFRLLSESSLSISEVAQRSGYSSDASFNRAFKRHFGLGPGAFQRQATADGAGIADQETTTAR